MRACFTTSAIPDANCRSLSVCSVATSATTARGCLNSTDQVLALGHVKTDLAADARVDHGDQVGRAVHEVEAAEVRRRGEPGDVADDGVAERDDRGRPIDVGGEQGVVHVLDGGQVLLPFGPTPAA